MNTEHQMTDTRERLLDAAERLFAENGITETSLRTITTEAGANLASVNYHFGSKEALFREVIARRLGPINQERLRLLDACERAAGDAPPPLEAVIRAFVAPSLHLRHEPAHGGEHFMRLMGRVHAEPGEWTRWALEQFKESFEHFAAAFGRVLPDLPKEELLWRMFFLIGVTAHTTGAAYKLKFFAAGHCDFSDVESSIRRLVTFAVAGFRAPLFPEDEKTS